MPGGQEKSPTDELTKLPLPLIPTRSGGLEDWHHHAHPKLDPLLQGEGGSAVRNSRIQRADARGNHFYYHNNYYGPPLPTTSEEQFQYTLLMACGYLPEYGLDFPNGKPIKKLLTPEHIEQLRSEDIKYDSYHKMRRFIRSYIAHQDFSDLPDEKVEQFLFARRKVQRADAADWILKRAVETATEPVNSTFNRARKFERLNPGIESKLSEFVLSNLVGKRFETESMQSKLRTRLGEMVMLRLDVQIQPATAAA